MRQRLITFRKNQWFNTLPFVCSGLLCLLAFVILCPSSTDQVKAEASPTTTYLPSSVVLTMASNVSATIEPSSVGKFQTMSAGIGIQVASSDAFSVSLRGDTEMHGSLAGNHATIKPVSAGSTEVMFGKNQWGYSWAEGDTAATVYHPVPNTETTLVSQDIENHEVSKTYTLGFGAKVDTSLPADTYTSSVVISVVATPQTIVVNNYRVEYNANEGQGTVPAIQSATRQEASWSFIAMAGTGLTRTGYEFLGWSESPTATTATYKAGDTISLTATDPQKTLYAVWKATGPFNGLTTMQGMTSATCSNAKYGETARLEDARDGKKYWVTKLADGNCWMTQNLDFDIPSTGLTVATGSKLDWNPNNPTQVGSITNNDTTSNTNSWDQGMYVYSDPIADNKNCQSVTGIAQCAPGGNGNIKTFINVGVDGYAASDDPDFTTKNGSPVNTNTKVYDAHYLIGNYYTYNAATAGTGATVSTEGANASGDICPRGWELPTTGAINESSGTSFFELLKKQGMTIAAGNGTSSYTSLLDSASNALTFLNTSKITTPVSNLADAGKTPAIASTQTIGTALTTAPLFFVRSGYVEGAARSLLWYSGYDANYWSRSSTSSAVSARTFWLYGTTIYPARDWTRNNGFSLRCLYHPAS